MSLGKNGHMYTKIIETNTKWWHLSVKDIIFWKDGHPCQLHDVTYNIKLVRTSFETFAI